MSVEEEHAYTNCIFVWRVVEALKIAIEAKLKKQRMYERNPDESSKSIMLLPISRRPPPTNNNDSQISQLHSIPSLPNISIIQPNNNTIVSQGSGILPIPKKNGKHDKAFFITQDYLNMNLLNKEL
jgi:hypothetical protein